MPNIGPVELIIVLVIALLILGPGKLPDVGAAIGKSIREFRKATNEVQDTVQSVTAPLAEAAPAVPPVASAPIAAAAVATAPELVAVAPVAPSPAPVAPAPAAAPEAPSEPAPAPSPLPTPAATVDASTQPQA
ncbi:MAG: twin-arginine translocase TatA/TatE family subunit [Chloroflexota bacterium]